MDTDFSGEPSLPLIAPRIDSSTFESVSECADGVFQSVHVLIDFKELYFTIFVILIQRDPADNVLARNHQTGQFSSAC